MIEKKIKYLDREIIAYKTKLNLFRQNNIYPHEETAKNNHITLDILKNSQIVLGHNLPFEDNLPNVNDNLFILDGHHRYEFINSNSIDEEVDIILVNIKEVVVLPYNCELLISKEEFIKKIFEDCKLLNQKDYTSIPFSMSNQFLKVGDDKFFSEEIKNLKDLYQYKKLLIEDNTISPLPNNLKSNLEIVQFSPLSYTDFEKDYLYPYKSTWIMPRFDQ